MMTKMNNFLVGIVVVAMMIMQVSSLQIAENGLPDVSISWGKNQSVPFSNRRGAACTQFNNQIFFYGGYGSTYSDLNDVWSGTISNGIVSFKQLIPNGNGPDLLYAPSLLALSKGTFLLLGGFSMKNYFYSNTVYSSTDAVNWGVLTRAAAWAARESFAAVVTSSDRIVVVGGILTYTPTPNQNANQSWISTDGGTTWNRGGVVPFQSEYLHAPALAYTSIAGGTLLLVGGFQTDVGSGSNVYSSTDNGMTWKYNGAQKFIFKVYHDLLTDANGGVYLIDQIDFSDSVWYTSDAGTTWVPIPGIQPGVFYGCSALLNDNKLSSIVLYSGDTLSDYVGYIVGTVGQ